MTDPRTSSFFVKDIENQLKSLSRVEKLVFVGRIWPRSSLTPENFDERAYDSFFQYLGDELGPLYQHRLRFAAETFDSTSDLIQFLSDHRSETLSRLLQLATERFLNVDDAAVQRSLELTVRLWLTVNVNSTILAVGPISAYEHPLDWSQDVSLSALIDKQFKKSSVGLNSNIKSRIDPAITAAYLVNVCGMKIRWTNILSDHLRFNRKSQILAVYKHKIYLLNHLKSEDGCPIPKEVLEETLDTLNLLFPFGHSSTKKLLYRENLSGFYGLGSYNRDRELDLTRYKYWREELCELIEASNEPPRSWRQLLIDRRNMMDWAAFWIAVMVLLLTLVSISCNIVQTVYTVKAYNMAVQQGKNLANG